MKKENIKIYAFWILFTEAVGAISGFLTRNGTQIYKETIIKPPLSPPAIVFPIAWVILYALMGIGIARIYTYDDTKERTTSVYLYLFQLFFNFCWSIVFFNFQAFGFAFFWLVAMWLLILWMTVSFYKIDKIAAYMQIPYLLWVLFAGYLNYGVWMLNR